MTLPAYPSDIRVSDMADRLLEKFVLHNDIKETTRLGELLAAFTEKYDVPPHLAFRIDLILDELVTNIIKYGYKDQQKNHKQEIFVEIFSCAPDILKIVIIDSSSEFNPLKARTPDVSSSIEERPIGGLGIHFAKQFTKEMFYQRKSNQNHLTMIIDFNEKLTQ